MQRDNVGEESDKTSEERVLPAEGSPIEEGGVVDSAEPHPRRWWVLAAMSLSTLTSPFQFYAWPHPWIKIDVSR